MISARAVTAPLLPQVRYARVYLRETTLISPFPMLLFGGDIEVQHRERLLSVDGWIHFQVRPQRARLTLVRLPVAEVDSFQVVPLHLFPVRQTLSCLCGFKLLGLKTRL